MSDKELAHIVSVQVWNKFYVPLQNDDKQFSFENLEAIVKETLQNLKQDENS